MAAERVEALLREREVTREYRLTGAWLRKRRRFRLPPVYARIGRMVYYRRSDLDEFFAAHRIEPEPRNGATRPEVNR